MFKGGGMCYVCVKYVNFDFKFKHTKYVKNVPRPPEGTASRRYRSFKPSMIEIGWEIKTVGHGKIWANYFINIDKIFKSSSFAANLDRYKR